MCAHFTVICMDRHFNILDAFVAVNTILWHLLHQNQESDKEREREKKKEFILRAYKPTTSTNTKKHYSVQASAEVLMDVVSQKSMNKYIIQLVWAMTKTRKKCRLLFSALLLPTLVRGRLLHSATAWVMGQVLWWQGMGHIPAGWWRQSVPVLDGPGEKVVFTNSLFCWWYAWSGVHHLLSTSGSTW